MPRLVLKRKEGERVMIDLPDGTRIVVGVQSHLRGAIQLVFEAPENVKIMREELLGQESCPVAAKAVTS